METEKRASKKRGISKTIVLLLLRSLLVIRGETATLEFIRQFQCLNGQCRGPRIASGASPNYSPRNGDCPRKSRGNAGGETLFLSILRRTRDLVLGKCCKKRRRLLCSQTQTLCHARLRFRTHFTLNFRPEIEERFAFPFFLVRLFFAQDGFAYAVIFNPRKSCIHHPYGSLLSLLLFLCSFTLFSSSFLAAWEVKW